jgi:hypothetical protein
VPPRTTEPPTTSTVRAATSQPDGPTDARKPQLPGRRPVRRRPGRVRSPAISRMRGTRKAEMPAQGRPPRHKRGTKAACRSRPAPRHEHKRRLWASARASDVALCGGVRRYSTASLLVANLETRRSAETDPQPENSGSRGPLVTSAGPPMRGKHAWRGAGRECCFVAHAASWPSLPLRSATASEQQSTSAPRRRLTWPPVRERESGRGLHRRGASLLLLTRCETDVVSGAETCIRVGACTRSHRGRRDPLRPKSAVCVPFVR